MEKLNQLIEQGYRIAEADSYYEREEWHLPTWLRASLDAAHCALIELGQSGERKRDESELLAEREHLLNQLYQFARFTGDKYLESCYNRVVSRRDEVDEDLKIAFFKSIISEIKRYLTEKMPFWKYDERLNDYGFYPIYYNSSYNLTEKFDFGREMALNTV